MRWRSDTKQTGLACIVRAGSATTRFIKGLLPRALGTHGSRLIALDTQTHVVDPASGETLCTLEHETHFWHPGARVALSFPAHGTSVVVHRLVGVEPEGPVPTVPTRENLLVLADALEAHGASADAVAHCRAGEVHHDRCWVLDALS